MKRRIGVLLMLLATAIALAGVLFMLDPFAHVVEKEYERFVHSQTAAGLQEKLLYAARYNATRSVPARDSTASGTPARPESAAAEGEEAAAAAPVPIVDPFLLGDYRASYEGLAEDEVYAYLSLPAIDGIYPVYLGADSDHLLRGVAHVDGTALPLGGAGTRAVIAGHRGRWNGEPAFAHIDLLEPGDLLKLDYGGAILSYQMVSSEVIEPADWERLLPLAGKDMVTLLACHPYGINTHRLLVHFERLPEAPEADDNRPDMTADPGAPGQAETRAPAVPLAGESMCEQAGERQAQQSFLSYPGVVPRRRGSRILLGWAAGLLLLLFVVLCVRFVRLLRRK